MVDPRASEFFPEFERLGETLVRYNHEYSAWVGDGTYRHNAASQWLIHQDILRAERADAREEETLSIAKSALSISKDSNDIARSARTWAIIAIVVSAAIAAITAYAAII